MRTCWILCLGISLGSGCMGGWITEKTPTDEDLYGVWGASGAEVFAVGAKGTVLQRKNDHWWKLDSGIQTDLYAVWGTGAEHVVAVGDDCAAVQFDGEIANPPDGQPRPPDLKKLSVSDCDKIGFRAIDGIRADSALVVGNGIIRRYDGSRLANFDTCGQRLLGLSVPAEGTAFAVGDQGSFCLYQDGSWRPSQVSICETDLVNGQCPTQPMLPVLWDVWAGKDGEGGVVGMFGGLWKLPAPQQGFWAPVETNLGNELHSVHGWSDPQASTNRVEIFAVGSYGAILRLKGDTLIRESAGTNRTLYGVWVSPSGNDIYVVGAKGFISHWQR